MEKCETIKKECFDPVVPMRRAGYSQISGVPTTPLNLNTVYFDGTDTSSLGWRSVRTGDTVGVDQSEYTNDPF